MNLFSYTLAGVVLLSLSGCKDDQKLHEYALSEKQLKFSLKGIIDDKKSPGFACTFGKSKVEIIKTSDSYKYLRLTGSGIVINSMWLRTQRGENPEIIYAVPKDSFIENGSTLVSFCISGHNTNVEGPEKGGKEVPFLTFYLIEEEH